METMMFWSGRFVRDLTLLFKEIKSFSAFFKKKNKEARTLTFYSEHGVYAKYFEDLIEAILKQSDLTISYVTSDDQDPFFGKSNERMKVYYVKNLLPFLIPWLDAGAIVMTMPDLGQYAIQRSMRNAHHVYVFHAMISTHMIYREGAFDHYDTVFCVGPHHLEEIRRREAAYGLRQKKLFPCGYFQLDKIYADHLAYLAENLHSENHKKTCLIAPSWAPQNIMETCLKKIVQELIQNEWKVIIRPHPEFVKRKPDRMTRLIRELEHFDDIEFEINPTSNESLHLADILITDWSGIALEYAFGTERPVLYIDTPRKVYNPEYGKLEIEPIEIKLRDQIGRVLAMGEVHKIVDVLSDLMEHQREYRENIIQNREKYVYHFRSSAAKAAEYLIRFLQTSSCGTNDPLKEAPAGRES